MIKRTDLWPFTVNINPIADEQRFEQTGNILGFHTFFPEYTYIPQNRVKCNRHFCLTRPVSLADGDDAFFYIKFPGKFCPEGTVIIKTIERHEGDISQVYDKYPE